MIAFLPLLIGALSPPTADIPVDVVVVTCPSASSIHDKIRGIVGDQYVSWPEDRYYRLVPEGAESGWILEEHSGPEVTHSAGPFRGSCRDVEDTVALYLAGEMMNRPPMGTLIADAEPLEVEPASRERSPAESRTYPPSRSVQTKRSSEADAMTPGGRAAATIVSSGVQLRFIRNRIAEAQTADVGVSLPVRRGSRLELGLATTVSYDGFRENAYDSRQTAVASLGLCWPLRGLAYELETSGCVRGQGGLRWDRSKDQLDDGEIGHVLKPETGAVVDVRGLWFARPVFGIGIRAAAAFDIASVVRQLETEAVALQIQLVFAVLAAR